jgi:DNA-binding NarL/FixJ family response regulator
VVEENDAMRGAIAARLDAHPGLAVVAMVDGVAGALRACTDHRPDIVVIDLALATSGDRDVLTTMRELVPGVRIVLFTGSPEAVGTTASHWGAAGMVSKDQDLDRLVHVLEEVAGNPLVASSDLAESRLSPAAARSFVESTLRDWHCEAFIEDALLVVSELVTNAVTHATSRCELLLRLATDGIRIEVADTGSGSPEPQSLDLRRSSGRGLLIVSGVSTALGIDPLEGGGKVVWAELAS